MDDVKFVGFIVGCALAVGVAIEAPGIFLEWRRAKRPKKAEAKTQKDFMNEARRKEYTMYYWNVQKHYDKFVSQLISDAEQIMWGNK